MSANAKSGFLYVVTQYSLPLIFGVVAAVLWANVNVESYEAMLHASPFGHHHWLTLHFLMNDVFMALFFGIAAKEITESVLPGGALNPPRKAVSPLLGTVGGVVGPIGVYLAWTAITQDPTIHNGWGIPTATDIALAWLVARLALGAAHPAVSFLLLLAVADDGIGLVIIAIFYPNPLHPVQPLFLALVLVAVGIAWVLRKRAVRNFWIYLLGPGVLSWLGLFEAHLHPALALVPIVPFMPSKGFDMGMYVEGGAEYPYTNPLDQFEHAFHGFVTFGLFAFGLVNAGVEMSDVGNATWAVLAALGIGKTLGVFVFAWVGVRFGFSLPSGMNNRSLLIAGMTAGVGLTVALFVAGVAFTDPTLQGAAKMGALLSAGIGVLVVVTARLLNIERVHPEVT